MKRLIEVDLEKVLKDSKSIAQEQNLLPEDCPKDTCLSIGIVEIIPWINKTNIILDADPPRLPPTHVDQEYSRHPTCEEKCGILGNPYRRFCIRDDNKGNVEVRAEWKP